MPCEHRYFVYILSSKSRRIYTGVTGDLYRRVMQHKRGEIEGFTQRYKVNRLVYHREFEYVRDAIRAETVIKGWLRSKKVALIERENPTWDDLADDWGKPWTPLNGSAQGRESRFFAPLRMTVLNQNDSSKAVAALR